MKVVVIASKTSSLLNFHGQLISDIMARGHQVIAIVSDNKCEDSLKKMGIKIITLQLNRTSISPVNNFLYFWRLRKILKSIKPDKVFSYTIKPVIFGSIAAHLAGIKEIYSLVCGLGQVYSVNNLKMKIIRNICNKAYKQAFKYNQRVIFQNQDDINDFVQNQLIEKDKIALIDGPGVDLRIFKKNKLPKNKSFIMVSRIVEEKGITEYLEAAKIIKNKYPDSSFTFIGAFDECYKKDYKKFLKVMDKSIVNYIPETNKVADFISKHTIFVLPTYYREGTPKTLLEAAAMGRPMITTNTPGCKNTVKDGVNGYFVKARDIQDLVAKMELMIKETNLQQMGDESYKMCVQKFDINMINKKMLEILNIK